MTPEQEIRAKALEIQTHYATGIAAAALAANRSFEIQLWDDGDLDDFVQYITNGKKPEARLP